MLKPVSVHPGDCLGLVGISGAVRGGESALEETVHEAEKRLRSYGFRVKTDPVCFQLDRYFTGSDSERAYALNRMFADPEVDGIICLKGGWGSSRMLNQVDFDLIRQHPKMFVGFSDITSVHLAMEKECGLITVHGPMGTTPQLQGEALESFLTALSGKTGRSIRNPDGSSLQTMKPGTAEAELVGGNLSLLCASLGTSYELDCRGRILFIEEIHEFAYAIDRYMTQMSLAGKLLDCCGLVFGAFTACEQEEPGYGYTVEEILAQAAAQVNGPVIFGLQAGHLEQPLSLPLGCTYKISASEKEAELFLER